MTEEIKIDPFGFREYDARWLYEKDINLSGIKSGGKRPIWVKGISEYKNINNNGAK